MPPLVEIEADSLPENTIMKKTLALILLLAGLTLAAQGRMLTWTGAVSDEWDTTTANWLAYALGDL